MTILQTCITTN